MRRSTNIKSWLSVGVISVAMTPGFACAQQTAQFETFVVATPKRPAVMPLLSQLISAPISGARNRPKRKPKATLKTEITATVFPGMNGLTASSNGAMGARTLSSNFDTTQQPDGHMSNTGFLQFDQAGKGIELGSGILSSLGSYPGVRFYTSPGSGSVSSAVGVYVFQDVSGRSKLVPMTDSTWKIDKRQTLTTGIATDKTWISSYSLNKGSAQADLVASSNNNSHSAQHGYVLHKDLSHNSSLYIRGTSGTQNNSNLLSYGVVKQIGSQTVSLDNYTYTNNSMRLAQIRLGLILPLRDHILTMQCLSQRIDPEVDSSERTEQTTTLNFGMFSRISSTLSVWQNMAFSSGATGPGLPMWDFSFGVDRVLSPQWRVVTTFDKGFGNSEVSIKGSLEYAVSHDLRIRLLYGPKIQFTEPGSNPSGFGFQIVRAINFNYSPSGEVSGEVFIDGKPCTQPIEVRCDDGAPVTSDKNGRFSMRNVDLGEHLVSLVPEGLPADLSSDESDCGVTVTEGHQAACAFHLHKVGSILGSIAAMPDQFGQKDPTADAAVVIEDGSGHATSSDIDGNFCLANLPRGQYAVSIDERSIPPDYIVQEPKTVTVTVTPDQATPKVHFAIMPKPHQVEYAASAN